MYHLVLKHYLAPHYFMNITYLRPFLRAQIWLTLHWWLPTWQNWQPNAQSHHTPGSPYRLFSGCLNKNRTSTHGTHPCLCGAIQFLPPRTGPVEFDACIISLQALYGFRDRKQPLNSPCRNHKGPVPPHTMPVQDFCKYWLWQFPYVCVSVPYGTLAGPIRALYMSRRIWKILEIPVRGPHDAHTGITPVSLCSPANYSIKP